MEQLSLCATATEAHVPRACAAQEEKPARSKEEQPWSSPRLQQLEKTCAQRHSATKKIEKETLKTIW